MTIKNLNIQTVAKLTEPGLYWDETLKGFGLIVRGKNRRSWIIQYRIGKQQRKYKFADASKFTAVQARETAKDLFADITKGRDPQGERKAAKQADRSVASTLTLRQALEKYIEMKEQEVREGTYRDNSLVRTKLYLRGAQYFGPLHDIDINAITRQAVAQRLHDIGKASGESTRGRARAQLSAAFRRLIVEGLIDIDENPCRDTRGQAERPKRERPLNEDEIRAVWNACDMNTDFGRIVRLLILTGCRCAEIGGLTWSEVDLDKGQIKLPGERTKNGRAHTLTLPKLAMDIIRSVPHRVDRDYLFGMRSRGFRSFQREKARFKDGITDPPWKLHDLRHTLVTGMCEIGVEPHIVEAVVNHQSGHKRGIAGNYNHAAYAKQIPVALARWADHVQSLVDGVERKVVPFPQSA